MGKVGPSSDWHPDMPREFRNAIITGDAKELIGAIPDESISLIFTDPVYSNIDDYRWLAETAVRVLKMDRACLVWCSKVQLPECQRALKLGGLTYQSTLFYTVRCKQATPIFSYGLIPWTTPCLNFAKGRYKCDPFIPDTFVTSRPSNNNFEWQKNPEVFIYWLGSFSKPGDVVLDPFCGSGTLPAACKVLGRNYVAFEINPIRAEAARERVCSMPPLLFTEARVEQATMF